MTTFQFLLRAGVATLVGLVLMNVHLVSRLENTEGIMPLPVAQKSPFLPPRIDYKKKCSYLLPTESPPTHGCRAHKLTQMLYCNAENLRIQADLINCRYGGEKLADVFGKREREQDEIPVYNPGALTLLMPLDIPPDEIRYKVEFQYYHYISKVLHGISVDSDARCQETIQTPTLLLTRYEYANYYHTMTDILNAFMVLPSDKNVKPNVVFLDGHAEGPLDSIWRLLFHQVLHVKHLPPGGVCFSRAILIPPGYSSLLWRRQRLFEPCPKLIQAFEKFVVDSLDLSEISMQHGRITIIERVPFIAHPRSKPENTERTIDNLDELQRLLQDNVHGSTVELVRLEDLDFISQLRLIRQTQILIGNHGAGLTNLLFLHDGASIVEFSSSRGISMFSEMATWKPNTHYYRLPAVMTSKLTQEALDAVLSTVEGIVK